MLGRLQANALQPAQQTIALQLLTGSGVFEPAPPTDRVAVSALRPGRSAADSAPTRPAHSDNRMRDHDVGPEMPLNGGGCGVGDRSHTALTHGAASSSGAPLRHESRGGQRSARAILPSRQRAVCRARCPSPWRQRTGGLLFFSGLMPELLRPCPKPDTQHSTP